MEQTAKALVIRCSNFYVAQETVAFFTKLGYGKQYDDVSVAGAVKNLVDPYDKGDVEFIYRQIQIAHKLHHVSDVVLINHLDCGAYGGSATFSSPEEERSRHAKDLTRAKEMIEHHFSDKNFNVIPILAKLQHDGSVDFERINA